jgi:NTP pyrophosphatase (non-canonical NTP hydrolase)
MNEYKTISEPAREIVKELRANGFTYEDQPQRQNVALLEEVGEFAGAYRRFAGWARRDGTFDDMVTELADVVITCYVTAAERNWDIDSPVHRTLNYWSHAHVYIPTELARLSNEAGAFVLASSREKLAAIIVRCYMLAGKHGWPLDVAINTKLDKIFTRGWKEDASL